MIFFQQRNFFLLKRNKNMFVVRNNDRILPTFFHYLAYLIFHVEKNFFVTFAFFLMQKEL